MKGVKSRTYKINTSAGTLFLTITDDNKYYAKINKADQEVQVLVNALVRLMSRLSDFVEADEIAEMLINMRSGIAYDNDLQQRIYSIPDGIAKAIRGRHERKEV